MTTEERLAAAEAHIADLAAIVAQQREQIAQQRAYIRELEGRLAKDRHNRSKPPTSDGLARKTKSLRKPSGKKPGGQLGHQGETLRLQATPDGVVAQRPTVCPHCQRLLGDGAAVVRRERRQVHELPPVRLAVTEPQALHVRCAACGQVSVGTFPVDVPRRAQYGPRVRALAVYLVEQQLVPLGRVQQLLADLFGVRLARGTLVSWIQQAARVVEPVAAAIKAALRQAPVLHSDETGVRRAGRLAWAHVTSTAQLTHSAIHPKRGSAATDAIGILPGSPRFYGGERA